MSDQNDELDIFSERTGVGEDSDLASIYSSVGVPVDLLAYTEEFEVLYKKYLDIIGGRKPTRAEVFRKLLRLRKSGQLPRMYRGSGHSVEDGKMDSA